MERTKTESHVRQDGPEYDTRYNSFMDTFKGVSAWEVAKALNKATPGVDWRGSSKGAIAESYALRKYEDRGASVRWDAIDLAKIRDSIQEKGATTPKESFRWLHSCAKGLDLTDAEDRAFLRGRVSSKLRYVTLASKRAWLGEPCRSNSHADRLIADRVLSELTAK